MDDQIDNTVWEKIIEEVDLDGNGEIDQTEFFHMMRRLLID